MNTRVRYLILSAAIAFASACSSLPESSGPRDGHIVVSLDEAKRLMSSGEVEEVFQPHQGLVTLMLKDGSARCFDQPHLDWVLSYVKDNGLWDKIVLAVE